MSRVLFQLGEFCSHSGARLPWKIDCDALTAQDLACIAYIIAKKRVWFSKVEGVPRGGSKLAVALSPYIKRAGPLLIVDDVLTTGKSMNAHRADRLAIGAVIFARGPCPNWITSVFQMHL